MNRIILIGNGFDLAHKLPTSYSCFIDWYWNQWFLYLKDCSKYKESDSLCEFILQHSTTWKAFLESRINGEDKIAGRRFFKDLEKDYNIKINKKELLLKITRSVETKGWVDVENDYYQLLNDSFDKRKMTRPKIADLNQQLFFLKEKLIGYLRSIVDEDLKPKKNITKIIYEPINSRDIAVSNIDKLVEHIHNGLTCTDTELRKKLEIYNFSHTDYLSLSEFRLEQDHTDQAIRTKVLTNKYPHEFFLPNEIMFLNFNYTSTANLYLPPKKQSFEINHIHGELSNPQSIIFGYGDELDDNYKNISNLNDNEYLKNFKSVKYLESDKYRKALQFMDAEPYQVYIMGHSCGNSDRTLLNTLFEHKNCVSIKPFYHKKSDGTDNYLDIIQNISRNFTDMKLMRDRVVNKTYCEAFSEDS